MNRRGFLKALGAVSAVAAGLPAIANAIPSPKPDVLTGQMGTWRGVTITWTEQLVQRTDLAGGPWMFYCATGDAALLGWQAEFSTLFDHYPMDEDIRRGREIAAAAFKRYVEKRRG